MLFDNKDYKRERAQKKKKEKNYKEKLRVHFHTIFPPFDVACGIRMFIFHIFLTRSRDRNNNVHPTDSSDFVLVIFYFHNAVY